MPIFNDDIDRPRAPTTLQQPSPPEPLRQRISQPPSSPHPHPLPSPHNRRLSEESLPLELCEGPIPDSPINPSTPEDASLLTSDRSVLIERLKRGESPTWIPTRHYNSILQYDDIPPQRTSRSSSQSSSLLPAAQLTPEKTAGQDIIDERFQEGIEIERPRSALHSGDFTHDGLQQQPHSNSPQRPDERISSQEAWFATSPPRNFRPSFHFDRRLPHSESFQSITSPLSASQSSTFAYQPPTSPLAQSITNDDLDPAPLSPERFANYRRQVFNFDSSPFSSPSRPPVSFRREATFPYQAHQPRRSLTNSNSFQHSLSPGTPSALRTRRLSFGSESSPIQHASMVGSYEESILRGRMSSTPSKPLDFMAQIGVLGKGNCKPNLKCPPHVTLSFPAVYYNYGNTSSGRSQTSDSPSPYVGQIDLENGLPNVEEEQRLKRKTQSRYADKMHADGDIDMLLDGHDVALEKRPSQRRSKKPSAGPRAPPGGSYRIPEQGQLQIIIKNQNKTAVKLFLIPYDLTGMEPGTKTFIRQRSYSNGPIIDDDRVSKVDPLNRPMLRYLIHLHICCPSKGRFYLYKSVRIVFANRVPEGKEKLRNETTWPEPRFTPYKPIRVMNTAALPSSPSMVLSAETAYRRRSLGYSSSEASRAAYAPLDMRQSSNIPSFGSSSRGNTRMIDAVPFVFPRRSGSGSSSANDGEIPSVVVRSPSSGQSSRPSTEDSSDHVWGASIYEKLTKGDSRYGGNAFAESAVAASPSEGLLSRRLKNLEMQTADQQKPSPSGDLFI